MDFGLLSRLWGEAALEQKEGCYQGGGDHYERYEPSPILAGMAEYSKDVAAIVSGNEGDGRVTQSTSGRHDPQEFRKPVLRDSGRRE